MPSRRPAHFHPGATRPVKTPNRWWLVLFAMLFIAGLAALPILPSKEPTYKSKPLSYWLQAYALPYPGRHSDRVESEAQAAIEALGTNAIPTLVRLIGHFESPLTKRVRALAQRLHFLPIRQQSPDSENLEALAAFGVLGMRGGPATPQLIEISKRETQRGQTDWAVGALAEIGPPAKQAVPMLLQLVTSTNGWIRQNTIRALGNIHADAPKVVPVLISHLRDPDPDGQCRLLAVIALQTYGPDARSAVPALVKLLNDPQSGLVSGRQVIQPATIRTVVSNALLEIDLDTAMNMGM